MDNSRPDTEIGPSVTSYNLVFAEPQQGKSIILQHLAIDYARQGHNVVYISLRLAETSIEKVFEEIMDATDNTQIDVGLSTSNMKRNLFENGRLQIKSMPMAGVTVSDIKTYITTLCEITGEDWTHIIIDDLELLSPTRTYTGADDVYQKQQSASHELYHWTHDGPQNTTVMQIWGALAQATGEQRDTNTRKFGLCHVGAWDNLLVGRRVGESTPTQSHWYFFGRYSNGGEMTRIPMIWHNDTLHMATLTVDKIKSRLNRGKRNG